jgi:phytoene/squalene synthetase
VVTSEEQIMKMKKAITQAVKVMGDRFGSTEADVERAIDELKASMQTAPAAAPQPSQSQAAAAAGT